MTNVEKESILNLISKAKFDEVFVKLKPYVYGIGNQTDIDRFETYVTEYLDQPLGFSERSYKTRLRAFVSTTLSTSVAGAVSVRGVSDELYELLCTVNFETQTTCFQNIYQYKNVSAFLLYGENPDELKWLYHQLLHEQKLLQAKPLSIDFTGNLNTSFQQLAQLLYEKFEIKNQDRRSLRLQIELYLRTSPLVIIIKYPGRLTELDNFYQSFYDLFSYLHTEIAPPQNKVIFLFVENSLDEYAVLNNNYFLWLNSVPAGQSYSQNAIGQQQAKIMDLAPIEKISQPMLNRWIEKKLYVPAVKDLSCDHGKCQELFKNGDSPYSIIQKLHEILKNDPTKTPDQWLTH